MKMKMDSVEKIRTEKPLDELWLQLRLFESEYYSKQFLNQKYKEITNDELNTLSAVFASNIKQAYEYYSAASNVSILTSPLLYYYGMMCLTNVLWASLNKIEIIKKAHGLKSDSKDSAPDLSNEYVIVHEKGSFPAFYSCFSDFPIKAGTKFYIKDVFSVIPELKTLYERIYREKSRLIKLDGSLFDYKDKDYLHFQSVLKNADFFKQYGVKLLTNQLNDEIYGLNFPLLYPLFGYPFQESMNGEIYFTLPIDFEKRAYAIPEACAHFIVMHCLGMLVRYEPIKWRQIESGKLSSDIILINQFIEISKRKFPNMILNGLLGKDMQFTMNNENNSYANQYNLHF